jgi:hypothetical protein
VARESHCRASLSAPEFRDNSNFVEVHFMSSVKNTVVLVYSIHNTMNPLPMGQSHQSTAVVLLSRPIPLEMLWLSPAFRRLPYLTLVC